MIMEKINMEDMIKFNQRQIYESWMNQSRIIHDFDNDMEIDNFLSFHKKKQTMMYSEKGNKTNTYNKEDRS